MKEAIRTALADAAKVPADSIELEHPADLSHGDYATNIALKSRPASFKNPREFAEHVVSELGSMKGVAKIEIAGPGFINFTLDSSALIESIDAADATWGRAAQNNRTVMLEYTSPNLFKPLHIGNLVGNVLGESVARLLEASGFRVVRANYPSDIGLTVAKGVWGLKKRAADPSDIKALGEAYRAGNEAYENDEAAKAEIVEINKKLYARSDEELNSLRDQGISTSRRHLDALCEMLGTTFDVEIYESQAAPIGIDLVKTHIEDGIFEISEGATVFPGEKYGLHTRVFLNSAGLPTYEAKDLGNFALKLKAAPEAEQFVVITGSEQAEYFKVVIAAIKRVFPEAADKGILHISNPFLTLTTGKMSSRKGNVLTGEDLIEELDESAKDRAKESRAENIEQLARDVSVAALKFQILKQGRSKNIVFDKERALSLEGDSGPYLQYAHARAHQIVERAHADGVGMKADPAESPTRVMRLVHRFPEIVEAAASHMEPHIVTTYLVQLAGEYNSWYAQEQILDGTPKASHKVAIVNAVRQTLKNGLWILGIPAPEKM